MGQLAVAKNDGVLRTLVGSCIGIALYDRVHKVAGLVHVVLPASRDDSQPPGKFVDTAIPALVREMTRLAGVGIRPTARFAGGANMFATAAVRTIGEQNIDATERVLSEMGIAVVGRHCGGDQGRRMSLDSTSGVITIEIVGQDPIELRDVPQYRRTRDV
jgi:chemotaxis protein CheD